jgi:hypothetical protein
MWVVSGNLYMTLDMHCTLPSFSLHSPSPYLLPPPHSMSTPTLIVPTQMLSVAIKRALAQYLSPLNNISVWLSYICFLTSILSHGQPLLAYCGCRHTKPFLFKVKVKSTSWRFVESKLEQPFTCLKHTKFASSALGNERRIEHLENSHSIKTADEKFSVELEFSESCPWNPRWIRVQVDLRPIRLLVYLPWKQNFVRYWPPSKRACRELRSPFEILPSAGPRNTPENA